MSARTGRGLFQGAQITVLGSALVLSVIGVLLILRNGFRVFWSPNAYRWHEEGSFANRLPQVSRPLSIALIAIAGSVILLREPIMAILPPEYRSANATLARCDDSSWPWH